MPQPVADRFWSKVQRRDQDACWPWTGSVNNKGYGRITIKMGDAHRQRLAHRVSLELHGVHVPPGSIVMHTCDNPRCVNPKHLKTGTQKDNMADCAAKGRHHRSGAECCPNGHKYTQENTVSDYRGGRAYRICRNARIAAYQKRKLETSK